MILMNRWHLHICSVAEEFWIYLTTYIVDLMKRILMLNPVLSQEDWCMLSRLVLEALETGVPPGTERIPSLSSWSCQSFSGVSGWRCHCALSQSTERVLETWTCKGSPCWKRSEDTRSCTQGGWQGTSSQVVATSTTVTLSTRDFCTNLRIRTVRTWTWRF